MDLSRALVVLALAVSLAGCSGGDAPTSETPSTPPAPASSAAPADDGGEIALGGDQLPEGWPSELPAYAAGTVLSVVVQEDGRIINASWASDESAEAAWTSMDTALRERGFVPVGDLGEESLFIQDESMTTDTYRSDTFEANLVVVAGEQATVLLNAERLP